MCPTALALRPVGSGVIYAVLVVMWAAYFIPRWLRRHEELSEARSVERFDKAMRILSRREPTPDRRYVVMPPRPAAAQAPARRVERARPAAQIPQQRTRPGLRTSSPVTVRRRRVLAAVLLVLVLSAALAPLLPLGWWSPLLSVVAVVGWLVHCRLQARTRTVVSRTRQAARKRSRSRLMRFDALERLMAVRRELAAERAAEELRWEESEAAFAEARAAEAAARRAEEEGWTPVPVPLPTYVTKPVAPRPAAAPVVASAAAPDVAPSVAPAGAPSDQPPAPMAVLLDDAAEAGEQLDAIIARRAVND